MNEHKDKRNKTIEHSSKESSQKINIKNPNSTKNDDKPKGNKYNYFSSLNSIETDNNKKDNLYKIFQTQPSRKKETKKKENDKDNKKNNKTRNNNLEGSVYNKLTDISKEKPIIIEPNKASSQRFINFTDLKPPNQNNHKRSLTKNLNLEENFDLKNKENLMIEKNNKNKRENYHIENLKKNNNNRNLNDNKYNRKKSKSNSTDHVTEKKIKDKIPVNLEIEESNLNKKKNKRNSVILYEPSKDIEKIGKMETLFRRFYHNIKKEQLYSSQKDKIDKLTKAILNIYKKEKKKFLGKLRKKNYENEIKELKRNLNYYKPIIKQRRNNSITSLDYISSYFLPTYESADVISLKENFDIEKNLNDTVQKTFSNINIINEESFYYRGKKYRNIDKNELLKYKRLYELAEEKLKVKKKAEKSFGFLYLRRKVNNLFIPADRICSFKDIIMDYPEDGDFIIDAIKKKFMVQNLINDFYIDGNKNNHYLWVKFPFAIKNYIKHYFYKFYCDFFFEKLKYISLKDKQKKRLKKIINKIELGIIRKFFHKFYFRSLLFQYIEKKNMEKMNNLKLNNEIVFEIENAFYDKRILTESFVDISFRPSNRIHNISIQEKKNKKEFKLDYIPIQRKIKYKFPHSITKVRNHMMKYLLRKERMKNRKLNYIDRKDIRNASMNATKKYKPVRFVKKVYDEITGNIYQYNLEQPSEKRLLIKKNNVVNHKKNISKDEIKAEEILKENKIMKMKRVLKLNQVNHYFKLWKFYIKEKNKKPKFFDIIIIMMKVLFTDNVYIKAAFMGELFFIKGKYLFIWFLNTIGERKRKERRDKLKLKKMKTIK